MRAPTMSVCVRVVCAEIDLGVTSTAELVEKRGRGLAAGRVLGSRSHRLAEALAHDPSAERIAPRESEIAYNREHAGRAFRRRHRRPDHSPEAVERDPTRRLVAVSRALRLQRDGIPRDLRFHGRCARRGELHVHRGQAERVVLERDRADRTVLTRGRDGDRVPGGVVGGVERTDRPEQRPVVRRAAFDRVRGEEAGRDAAGGQIVVLPELGGVGGKVQRPVQSHTRIDEGADEHPCCPDPSAPRRSSRRRCRRRRGSGPSHAAP